MKMRYTTFVHQSTLIKSKLKALDSQLSHFSDLTEPLSALQTAKVKTIQTTAVKKVSEFEAIVSKLFNTEPLPSEIKITEISEFQDAISDLYLQINSVCMVLLPPETAANVSTASVSSPGPSSEVGIRLPRLNLGIFSGQPDKWIAFHSLFESSVHKNNSISDVEKFMYLLSCLDGEPLSLIKSLPTTPPNYHIAWKQLIQRYHNSRYLVSLHINNILDLPSVHRWSSVKDLRQFVTLYQENVSALQSLGHNITQESLFLTSYILRKFDHDFVHKYEEKRKDSNDVPNIKEFIEFIEKECLQLEAADLTFSGNKTLSNVFKGNNSALKPSRNPQGSKLNTKAALFTSTKVNQCVYCSSGDHSVYKCSRFTLLSPDERLKFVQNNSLCNNCLNRHNVRNCMSRNSCSTCHRRHHSMLHFEGSTPQRSQFTGTQVKRTNHSSSKHNATSATKSNSKDEIPDQPKSASASALVGLSHSQDISVLLGTTLVQVSNGKSSIVIRAVLDSAAQHSFMTESCSHRLNIQPDLDESTRISGISATTVLAKGICRVDIKSLSGDVLAKKHPVVVIEKITNNLPSQQISKEVRNRMRQFVLADPSFDTPSPVDMLIGADLFSDTLLGDKVSLGKNLPTALETIFGYVLIGNAPVLNLSNNFCSTNLLTISDFDLHNAIQRFWTMENPPDTPVRSTADVECENHFKTTHSRDSTGRYVCHLPFKESPLKLGDTSKLAKNIFYSLERKFKTQPELKEKYVEFMSDYRSSGHMKLCESAPQSPSIHYFLPHHGVFKDGKIRVVFNASAPSSTGVTLNDILHQGPKLHNNITDIIFRFRQHRIAFGCDIKQMFRMISIHEEDQHFQLIFWRENSTDPLQVFQLTTVTYGMTSSPYIANRVIQQLIEDEGHNHPRAAAALRHGIYVDDALVGSDTLEDALELQDDIIQLMKKGGFALRKWSSNNHSILEAVPEAHRGTPLQFHTPDQPLCSVLGLKWLPEADGFSYLVNIPNHHPTKRVVISTIAHIYDPMGWIVPVVFYAKALMQLLWTKGLQWDDPLPSDILPEWTRFLHEMPALQKIFIPRHVDTTYAKSIQLHGFCDASESGFCASVIVRTQTHDNSVNTCLLISKSRVAPLKRVTLPRLELCGAQMLSKLLHYCASQLSSYLTINHVYGWCDSKIVLAWIKIPAYRLKTYVANRVSDIQSTTTPITWLHISSEQNPADCGSRGLLPSQLINHSLWWKGPLWLKSAQDLWPATLNTDPPAESLLEIKPSAPAALHATETLPKTDILQRFSSWTKLVHVIAYILRFIHRCQHQDLQDHPSTLSPNSNALRLSLEEINDATTCILRLVQEETFAKDIIAIKNRQVLPSHLQKLSPFIDQNKGLVRVGGRLANSSLHYDAKHPVLLPKHHFVTNLIIDYYHLRYLHCGPQQLQSLITQKYWILSARSAIRTRIFRCIRCYKCKPKLNQPPMASLPEARVAPTKAFVKSAVDFAGPFNVKIHKLRRLQHVKVYLCLFICLSTKATHIEVVMDLTSEAFIASLTRFISRRGYVSHLYSDNATNFVGAARLIRRTIKQLVQQDPTQHYLTENSITFHFIPPKAPHFGGLWERAIRSAKTHMRRVIGDQILTVEEFTTLCCRIEAMLNSRPLTPLSSDPRELEALTPGHFITGGPLVGLPEVDNTDLPMNRLRRWQLIQSFAQHIWKRWQREYLHTLQHRPKWNKLEKNLEVDDLVLVHEDNLPPLQWRMGRITKVFPGADNITRVAEVITSSGMVTRPAVKLSKLPLS